MAWRSPTVRAEDSSVVILGDNTDSPISIGIPPAALPGIIKAATKPLEDLTDQQRRDLELLRAQFEVSAGALRGFLLAIGEADVPIERQPAKLAEIATRHKDLLARLEATSSTDPEVQRLKAEAREALDAGDFGRTEELLNRAKARDLLVIEQIRATMERMQAALDARRLSAAEAAAENGALMMTQLRYADAARYYAEAVGLTPETHPDALSDRLRAWIEAAWRAGDFPRQWRRRAAPWRSTRHSCPPKLPGSAPDLNNLAVLYRDTGRYTEAEPLFQRAIAILDKSLPPDHPNLAVVRENYAGLLDQLGCSEGFQVPKP